MNKKIYADIDVVEMARQRVKNIFSSAGKVLMSFSGGKDSICLNDVVYKLALTGEIDKSKLEVNFIDEEAIYQCVEEIVRNTRERWMRIGVKFNWWTIQVKHFNCFNSLTNDESFICWDETKKDVWVRPKPEFSISHHPLLVERKDKYQDFLTKYSRGKCTIVGVRVAESLMRNISFAKKKTQDVMWPIYDWTDKDVWKYIKDNNLPIPNAYLYMYQVGANKKNLRISQFFSIDTARSLVQMCEFYPQLFDRICKREPNAYMAMLYYDTEFFRKGQKQKELKEKEKDIDYKAKFWETTREDWRFETKSQRANRKTVMNLVWGYGVLLTDDDYKKMYQILVGGDPKHREFRGLQTQIMKRKAEGNG